MRPSGRAVDELRQISLEPNCSKYAEGSCLVSFGDTQVMCAATVEQRVPQWLRGSGRGWITAEYGMLPRSTSERTRREATGGGQSGRSHEIQRLIGRSMRAVVDMEAMKEMQIRLDCDVLQADGGTRTAAITGGYVALHLALERVVEVGILEASPRRDLVAAVSSGLYQGTAVLDLDYEEDSEAEADANFVLSGSGDLIEVQATAEAGPFAEEGFADMFALARKGIAELILAQRQALGLE